ncbi:solute carrier family 23 protein [Vibrio metschnikovii]
MATSEVSGEPVKGPVYMKRIKGAYWLMALFALAALTEQLLLTSTFSQNNGVDIINWCCQPSRVWHFIAAMLMLALTLSGVAKASVQLIPEPVLGGATICSAVSGTIAAAGVNESLRELPDQRAILIMHCLFDGLQAGIGA